MCHFVTSFSSCYHCITNLLKTFCLKTTTTICSRTCSLAGLARDVSCLDHGGARVTRVGTAGSFLRASMWLEAEDGIPWVSSCQRTGIHGEKVEALRIATRAPGTHATWQAVACGFLRQRDFNTALCYRSSHRAQTNSRGHRAHGRSVKASGVLGLSRSLSLTVMSLLTCK